MLNKVFLQGYLTKDIETRTTQNNVKYCFFQLAVPKDFGDQTDFLDCRAWKHQANFLEKHGKKGIKILIKDARLSSYSDDGKNRMIVEVSQLDIDFKATQQEGQEEVKEEASQQPTVEDDDNPF